MSSNRARAANLVIEANAAVHLPILSTGMNSHRNPVAVKFATEKALRCGTDRWSA